MSQALTQRCAVLFGHAVDLVPLQGGGNARVFLVQPDDIILKAYPEDGTRRRSETEFGALRLLWDRGARCVPEPITRDGNVALFRRISGSPVTEIDDEDIERAADFMVYLDELGLPDEMGAASDACFSFAATIDSIRDRLRRLRNAAPTSFLNALEGKLNALENAGQRTWGADWSKEISRRIPSPSDFGFHNALRRPSGELVWLDFEYFGWDDPVKTMADFGFHPAMSLTLAQAERFTHRLSSHFGAEARARRATGTPLWGLKWCCILLNEFTQAGLIRRQQARHCEPFDAAAIQARQLAKAQQMLRRVTDDYENS